jgi:hypothetical protein
MHEKKHGEPEKISRSNNKRFFKKAILKWKMGWKNKSVFSRIAGCYICLMVFIRIRRRKLSMFRLGINFCLKLRLIITKF